MKIRISASLLTAIVFVVMLILSAVPVSADATVNDIVPAIHGWNGGGTGSLSASVSGKTVTVTGTVARAEERLEINIPEDVTVVWLADYSGNTSRLNSLTLIRAYGTGTFVVPEGGSLKDIADGGCAIASWGHVVVSGGIIVSSGFAVNANLSVTITGGTVTAAGIAVYSAYGDVIISGGTIISQSNYRTVFAYDDITMTGGTVQAGKSGTALHSEGGDVTVAGGMILASEVLINGYHVTLGGDAELTDGGAILAVAGATIIDGNVTLCGRVGLNKESTAVLAVFEGATLTIPSGETILINEGSKLLNYGTIQNEGMLVNRGEIGTIKDGIKGTGSIEGTQAFSPPPMPEFPQRSPFIDVSRRDTFYDGVMFVYNKGLMNGMSEERFGPYFTLTRGMFVTILYRNAGQPDVSALENPFTDVTERQWYTKAVIWAADNGIVSGIGSGKFAPKNDLTREQFTVILYRLLVAEGRDLQDAPADYRNKIWRDTASDWSKEALDKLTYMGVFQDTISPDTLANGGRLDPLGGVLRSEVATVLYRLLGD